MEVFEDVQEIQSETKPQTKTKRKTSTRKPKATAKTGKPATKRKTAAKKAPKKSATVKTKPSRSSKKSKVLTPQQQALLGQQKQNSDVMAQCRSKIQDAIVLQQRIENGEALLKELKEQLREIETKDIPEIFKEMGVPSLELDDGVKCKVSKFVSGSIPKDPDEKKKAFALLRKLKGGDLIKNTLTAKFARGENSIALAALKDLKSKGIAVEKEQSVHAQSLQKFARELIEEGTSADLSVLGIYQGSKAKITLPK